MRRTDTLVDCPADNRPPPPALSAPDVPVTRQLTGPPTAVMRTLHDSSLPIPQPSTASRPGLGGSGSSVCSGGCEERGAVGGVLDGVLDGEGV
ncbi:hypothetical protein E1281_39100, partial [Actinomadura sp. KC345]|uniref:hypothetical protein n=1 Tax=Actinomadura sp. KC345 TaxID=2530371 RepID=UPI0010E8F8BC